MTSYLWSNSIVIFLHRFSDTATCLSYVSTSLLGLPFSADATASSSTLLYKRWNKCLETFYGVCCQRQGGSQYSSAWTSQNYCHQMPNISLKMHQILFQLGLRSRPRWDLAGELMGSPDPSWIWGKGKGKEKRREKAKGREARGGREEEGEGVEEMEEGEGRS